MSQHQNHDAYVWDICLFFCALVIAALLHLLSEFYFIQGVCIVVMALSVCRILHTYYHRPSMCLDEAIYLEGDVLHFGHWHLKKSAIAAVRIEPDPPLLTLTLEQDALYQSEPHLAVPLTQKAQAKAHIKKLGLTLVEASA